MNCVRYTKMEMGHAEHKILTAISNFNRNKEIVSLVQIVNRIFTVIKKVNADQYMIRDSLVKAVISVIHYLFVVFIMRTMVFVSFTSAWWRDLRFLHGPLKINLLAKAESHNKHGMDRQRIHVGAI